MGKRINFSEKTKKEAAEKVAYFCSNPSCCRPTVGPNEDGKAHHYGEAAHIYAATSGGPRAHELLSEDFLKSEANCLWLCNSCHELIDANPKTYNPELLKEWKHKAEQRAFEMVSNPVKAADFIDNIERKCGFGKYFDDLFRRGDFHKIFTAIGELSNTSTLTSENKEELVFAKLRFDCFCARKNIEQDIVEIRTISQGIKERIVDFAIETYDEYLCDYVKNYSNYEFKRILSSLIAEHKVFDEVAKWLNEKRELFKNKQTIDSALIIGSVKNSQVLVDLENKQISKRGNWLLDACDTIAGFIYDTMIKKPIDGKQMHIILDNIEIYKWLDSYYISLLFDKNFPVLPRCDLTTDIFNNLIDSGVSTSYLRLNYFLVLVPKDKFATLFERAINLGQKYDDHQLLTYSLLDIVDFRPDYVIEFIENNWYYICNDLLFLEPYQMAKRKLGQNFDALKFLSNDYIGEKTKTYYVINAHEHLIAGNTDLFSKFWEEYKKDEIDFNSEYIGLALEIAFQIHDELLIKEICVGTQSAAALLYAGSRAMEAELDLDTTLSIIDKLESLVGKLPENYNGLMFNLYCKVQKFNEALKFGRKIYFEEKEESIAPYIIQILLDLGVYEEDDFILDVSKKTTNPYALNMLGQFYLRLGKRRDGWNYLARSVSMHKDEKDLSFYSCFFECEFLSKRDEANEYSYILTKEGKAFLLLPQEEKKYYSKEIFGTNIIFIDECNDICFSRVGDLVKIDLKNYTITKIYDYFYFFYLLAFKHLVSHPSTIAIKGNTPKEAIDEIFKIVKKSETEQNNFLKSTDGKPLPLFLFKRSFGKGLFQSIEALYFSPCRSSFFIPKTKITGNEFNKSHGFLLDTETIYLFHRLGISLDTIKKDKCRISALTKGAMINEITEKTIQYKDDREKGTLTLNESKEKLLFNENDRFRRRGALKELQNITKIVNSLEIIEGNLKGCSKEQSDIVKFFTKEKDLVDLEVLKCLWNGETLVTNNQAFHIGQQLGKGKAIDLLTYLSLSSCSVTEIIKVLKNIKKTNIKQYLTPDVFKSIMNKLNKLEGSEEKTKVSKEVANFIKGNWDGTWTESDKETHNALVYVSSINQRDLFNKFDDIRIAINTIYNDVFLNYFSVKRK